MAGVTEYFETRNVPIDINPCLACGSRDIELWDSGYTSFNPGGGRCRHCKREVKTMVPFDAPHKELAAIWNAENDVRKRLLQIEEEIQRLRRERDRLELRLL